MDTFTAALRFVTGLPTPALPAPVPSELIQRVPTIRTQRGRGKGRGYGLAQGGGEEGRQGRRRVTPTAGPAMVADPVPAATGAAFHFNPIVPEKAAEFSRTYSATAEQQDHEARRRAMAKRPRRKTWKAPAPKRRMNLNTIDEDVLRLIFVATAEVDPGFGRRATLVCRRWYHLAHSTPSLWAYISICSARSYTMAEEYLERSRTAPLTVYLRNLPLHEAVQDPYFFSTAVGLLKPHIQRITALTVRTHTAESLSIALAALLGRSGAPLLKLDVSLCVSTKRAPKVQAFRWTLPTSIQDIAFDRIVLTHTGTPRALRSLHISRPEAYVNNFQTLRQLAAAYPALKSLRIDNWDHKLVPVQYDGLKDVALAQLEDLKLWKCRADNIQLLLQHLSAPNLATVDIAFNALSYEYTPTGLQPPQNAVVQELVSLQKAAIAVGVPGIQSLSLAGAKVAVRDLYLLIECLRSLRRLSFNRCNITDDVLNMLGNAGMCKTWLCPQLESLRLEECSAVEGVAVRQFAFNRWCAADNGWAGWFREFVIRGCYRITPEDAKFCQQRVPRVDFSP